MVLSLTGKVHCLESVEKVRGKWPSEAGFSLRPFSLLEEGVQIAKRPGQKT